ncbi:MAG TPA: Ig-like domain-containing protein, partial [Geobacteraceae bacterium]
TNVSGLAITPTITSSNPAFAVSAGSCGSSVAAGATCTFGVNFTPTANGTISGTISVSGPSLPIMTATVTGTGDGIAPSLDITTISRFSSALSQTLSGTVTDNIGIASVQLFVNGGFIGNAAVTGGSWSVNVTGLIANAVNNISVIAADTAGNQSLPATDTITHDSIAPVLGPISVTSPTNSTSQLISGTITDSTGVSFVQIIVNGSLPDLATVNGTSWSYTVTGLTPGDNTIDVIAQDPAGNQSLLKSVTITVIFSGTADGVVINNPPTPADARLVLETAVGLTTLTQAQFPHADVAPLGAPDSKITITDALMILKKVVGLINF